MAERFATFVRRAAWLAGLACALAPGTVRSAPPPAPAPSPAQVAAEMVERFTRFIEWPEDALGSEDAFVVCLWGQDEVGPALESLARARRFKERPVEVRHLADGRKVDECHLLWIGEGARAAADDLLGHAGGRPILTVGQSPGLGARGALINLQPAQGHLSFELNLHEVRRSRLAFSSRLLRLGTLVGPEREAAP
jgi:hypothetical protein